MINYNGSEAKADEVKHEIVEKGGCAQCMQCNVADYEGCEAFIKAVIEQFGRIDILVNNAGITKDGLLMRMSEEDFSDVIDVNLKGTFHCIRFYTSSAITFSISSQVSILYTLTPLSIRRINPASVFPGPISTKVSTPSSIIVLTLSSHRTGEDMEKVIAELV